MNKYIITSITWLLLATYVLAGETYKREENVLRVMSYNVHNCLGMDNRFDYDRIAGIINRVNPDVAALQELDSITERNSGIFAIKELGERTLMHYTYGAAINFQGGKYGIGILSKEKPTSYQTIALPGREEKRLLLLAEFNNYIFCCTHFSLTQADREASVPIIFNALKDVTKPVLFAGDMNCEYGSDTQKSISKKFITVNDPKKNTIPVVNPDRCIDFIYAYVGNGHKFSVTQSRVLDERIASDHLPLFADIRIATDASQIMRTKPYLQNPADNGITITWLTNVPVHSWVRYGTDSRNLNEYTETLVDGQVICYNKHHKIRLNKLDPDATYYYRVYSREVTLYEGYKKEFGETAASDLYSFATPADSEADFTAIIMNDLHKKKPVIDKLSEVIGETDYDFVIFNGDFIDDPKDEDVAVEYLSYMNEKVGAEQVPVIYIRGNHEIRNAYSIRLRDLIEYVGDGPSYGAFSWGDTRFVLLDCGEDKPDSTAVYHNLNSFQSFRLDQVDFLKEEMKKKEFKSAKRRILVHHIPIYGMSAKSYVPCKALWQPLLAKAPFDIAINGHTHRFAYHEKSTYDNNFPVVIGGGNTVESATVMILRKTGNSLTLTVKDTTGKTLIEKNL